MHEVLDLIPSTMEIGEVHPKASLKQRSFSGVLVTVLVALKIYLTKTTFKKKEFVLAHGFRVKTTVVWKLWRQECEVPHWICGQEEERERLMSPSNGQLISKGHLFSTVMEVSESIYVPPTAQSS